MNVARWTPAWKPSASAAVRLFCLPYAGGNAAGYRSWTRALAPQVDVCALQLAGRGGRIREAPLTRIGPLVAELAEVVAPYLDLPFALFGHSMGAAVAFELGRTLSAQGRPPVHVFVSGRRAPLCPDPHPPVADLSDEQFATRIREMNGTPQEVLDDPDLMRMVLPMLRADFELNGTYRFEGGPALRCPLTVLGGEHDPEASTDELDAWRAHAGAGFHRVLLPGDHFFVHTAEGQVLETIRRGLGIRRPAFA